MSMARTSLWCGRPACTPSMQAGRLHHNPWLDPIGATARMITAIAGRCMADGDVTAQIQELEASAAAELREVKDAAGLEQYRIKYLGSNGQLKAAMKWLGQ